jgi:hypothetical protein
MSPGKRVEGRGGVGESRVAAGSQALSQITGAWARLLSRALCGQETETVGECPGPPAHFGRTRIHIPPGEAGEAGVVVGELGVPGAVAAPGVVGIPPGAPVAPGVNASVPAEVPTAAAAAVGCSILM